VTQFPPDCISFSAPLNALDAHQPASDTSREGCPGPGQLIEEKAGSPGKWHRTSREEQPHSEGRTTAPEGK
jgi:hypothetical protein